MEIPVTCQLSLEELLLRQNLTAQPQAAFSLVVHPSQPPEC